MSVGREAEAVHFAQIIFMQIPKTGGEATKSPEQSFQKHLEGHTKLKKPTSVTIFSRDVLDPLSLFCRRRSRHKQVLHHIKV